MRWAVVQDSDGSSEYQKVYLEPSDWYVNVLLYCYLIAYQLQRANKCKKKSASGKDGVRTVEWYTWEISRLTEQNRMLNVFKAVRCSSISVLLLINPIL
jgi:hypothetical protein